MAVMHVFLIIFLCKEGEKRRKNRLFWYQFVSSPSDSDTSHIIFIKSGSGIENVKVQLCVV